jgi:hypothetical protein
MFQVKEACGTVHVETVSRRVQIPPIRHQIDRFCEDFVQQLT